MPLSKEARTDRRKACVAFALLFASFHFAMVASNLPLFAAHLNISSVEICPFEVMDFNGGFHVQIFVIKVFLFFLGSFLTTKKLYFRIDNSLHCAERTIESRVYIV